MRQASPSGTAKAAWQSLALDELTIEDERSFRHIELYDRLKRRLRADGYRFRVPAERRVLDPGRARVRDSISWDRALFLNLTFWSAGEQGDVLTAARVAADVVVHVGWHHVARRALGEAAGTAGGLLLGEAVASASDLYLVGRLLGHAPESEFLATQVPAMADVAEANGLEEGGFELLLEDVAAAPERAFEDLRALLFDASTALLACRSIAEASDVLERYDGRDGAGGHRFAPLLHHYELSNWVLYARAYATDMVAGAAPERLAAEVAEVDAALRGEPDALAWLDRCWVG